MSEFVLEMRDVCKSFPGVKALDHVQLKLRPGTVHALMGENGAGKSTTLNILTGYLSSTSGTVRVGGIVGDRLLRRVDIEIRSFQ